MEKVVVEGVVGGCGALRKTGPRAASTSLYIFAFHFPNSSQKRRENHFF
jgi:hypothetical protein